MFAFLHFLLLLHTVLNRSIFVGAYLRNKSNKMYYKFWNTSGETIWFWQINLFFNLSYTSILWLFVSCHSVNLSKNRIPNRIPKSHTALSSYIWKLKEKQTPYFVNWLIKARGHAFSSGGRACNLCLTEKLIILTADQNTMLNRRDELLESCRHRRKHLLVSLFPPKKKEPPDTTVK